MGQNIIDSSPFLETFCVPIFQIGLNIFTTCFALVLLRIIRATQLHRNCKYLLTAWAIGYLGQFSANAAMGMLNLCMDRMPLSLVDPPLRFYLINVNPGLQIFCAIHEIVIASDRIYSSIRPERYYHSSQKYRLIVISILISILSVFETILVNEGYQVIVGAFLSMLDVTTLIVNGIAVRYCQSRYLSIYGHASLNARYQVKEALDLASAMQPAYVLAFIGKNVVNFGTISTCITFDDEHNCIPFLISVPWIYIEVSFCTGQSLCSLFLLSWLLFKHPRLHRNLLIQWGNPAPKVHSVVDVASVSPATTHQESDVYFDNLKKAWA